MGFLDSIFGEEDEVQFRGIPQSEGAKKARTKIEDIAFGELPTVPLRGIAQLPERTEERDLAREQAKKSLIPQEQGDFLQLPEVQGIIQEVTREGNLLANRLGRSLQASGNITSTPGRDVLGRAVTDVQKSLSASLAPFASEQRSRAANERQRIQNLIPLLESLGLTEEAQKQQVRQSELDALFQKESIESNQIQNFLIPILRSIIGDQPGQLPVIEPGRMGIIEQVGQVAGLVSGFSGFNKGNTNSSGGAPSFNQLAGTSNFRSSQAQAQANQFLSS